MALVYLPVRTDIPALSTPADKVFHAWSAANDVPLIDLTRRPSPHIPLAEISHLLITRISTPPGTPSSDRPF
jgi:hypothetical protein